MSLRDIAAFSRALLDPCMAMTRRGLRVDDTLRRTRLATLTDEAQRLNDEAQALALPILQRERRRLHSALFAPKLTKAALVAWVTQFGVPPDRARHAVKSVLERYLRQRGVFWTLNLGSPKQLAELLYVALRLPRRTRDGKVTADEEALQSVLALDSSGLVALALRYAKLATMAEIYERIAPDASGHVHTVYNPAGTYTGRFSSQAAFYVDHSTNLQNLPGADEGKRNPLYAVRDCIVPDDNEVLVEGDLSQAEARVVACLTRDDDLLEQWQNPQWDAHRWTAARIYACAESAVTPTQRYIGKRSRHALNYGEGPTKFWRVVNADADITGTAITLPEAKRIHKAYHTLHPNLDRVWWNDVERKLLADEPLVTCFGRQCRFSPRLDPITGAVDADTLRAAIAYEPQATVTQIAKLALLEMFRAENGAWRVLHEQHDSVLLGVRRDRLHHAARTLKRAMEREITVNGYRLTIPCEVFVSRECWGKKERLL